MQRKTVFKPEQLEHHRPPLAGSASGRHWDERTYKPVEQPHMPDGFPPVPWERSPMPDERRHHHHPGGHNLAELRPGQSCVIVAIGGESALKRRFADMGLTPGCRVTLRKTAPLGDPLEINLRGYELSLRRADAKKILVEGISEAL